MGQFETVATVDQIPLGRGRMFVIRGHMIAIFRRGEEFFAMDDACPHMGASLAEGSLEGDAVYCPWHAWRFCIKDGTWLDNPRAKLRNRVYPVRIVGSDVQVELPAPDAGDAHEAAMK